MKEIYKNRFCLVLSKYLCSEILPTHISWTNFIEKKKKNHPLSNILTCYPHIICNWLPSYNKKTNRTNYNIVFQMRMCKFFFL